jgi:hypothetical protein
MPVWPMRPRRPSPIIACARWRDWPSRTATARNVSPRTFANSFPTRSSSCGSRVVTRLRGQMERSISLLPSSVAPHDDVSMGMAPVVMIDRDRAEPRSCSICRMRSRVSCADRSVSRPPHPCLPARRTNTVRTRASHAQTDLAASLRQSADEQARRHAMVPPLDVHCS